MFTHVPITDRVSRMRARYRDTFPYICTARYRLITEFYQEHEELTGILKRARAMKHIFDNIPVRVEDDDIIVGAQGTSFRSCAIYPEYTPGTLAAEVASGNVTSRHCDPYKITEEDAAYILEHNAYWEKHCLGAMNKAYTLNGLFDHNNSGTTTHNVDFASPGPVGHFCTGYHNAIDKGFAAIKAEADEKLKKLEEEGVFGTSIDQYNFYRAVSLVSEGMINLTKRYAARVREMEAAEKRPERKAELGRMADTLEWCMEKPARNFLDAVQALYMYETCLALEGNMHGMSFGRIDQYLGKYYERDIAAGTLTPEYAQEILDTFFLKVAEMNKFWADAKDLGQPGYTSGQLITIGGVDPVTGEDATNDVTYMVLQCSGRLVLHDPPVALRVHKGTPDDLWEAAIETTKLCGGVPSFESDEIIIPSLMDRGLSPESARNYCLIGCVEPAGCGDEWPACGGTGSASYWNMANALWLAINNGYNPMPVFSFHGGGESEKNARIGGQVGLPTGYLYEMESFDQVLDAFKKQTEFFVKWHASMTNSFEYVARQQIPLPVVSATMDGCMEKGMDVMFGGARYNSTGIAGVGIGNVADSLQTIKYLCYDTKKCTTRQLYDALINNWEGYEDLRAFIKNEAPHYGNGDPEADRWAGWAADVFADAVNSCTGPRGRFSAGLYPVTTNIMFGRQTAATPDGRAAREPLADGISPVQQMDTNGPTAVLVSTTRIDHRKYPNGTLLNMKFSPSCLNGEDGVRKLTDLMKTFFFQLLGMEMQINVVSAETLRAAQKNPEEYKNLVVRIAGFSVYFVEMHTAGQNDLISRTELSM